MASNLLTRSPLTESSIRCTVSVNGATPSQEWEMASGGAKTAATTKVRIGYEPTKRVTLPAVADSGDVTITRHMVKSEVWALQSYLLSQVGRGTAIVWMTPMDAIGTADYGHAQNVTSLAYEGLISSVTPVQASNESATVASFSVTLTGGDWKDAN
jgi:hypothetical protein